MTFLTRFELNRGRRSTQWLLASPQRVHAAVLAGFRSDEHALPGRVLWRLDRGPMAWHLYIVSPAQPDLTHLAEQAGWPTKAEWQTRDYEPLLARLAPGQRWAFRLRANPSYVRTDGDVKKVRSHVTGQHQTRWLVDRCERLGIALPPAALGEPDVVVRDASPVEFTREGKLVRIYQATYDGTLEVVDPEALRTALVDGVGRSKAYGCGLLTLAAS